MPIPAHRTLLTSLALWALTSPAQAAPTARASASSVHEDEAGKHSADAAFDGLLQEGWGEGESGSGEGAWLELDLRATQDISSLSIWPGNLAEGKKSYREYSRPRVITILLDGKPFGNSIRLLDEMQRLDVPVGQSARKLRIQVDEVFEGFVFQDMYIAEVGINFTEDLATKHEKLEKWLDSEKGMQAQDAYEAELNTHYQNHKKAEFGAPESLAWIMRAAGDGAPYLREQVVKWVPTGQRAATIKSDEKAISALRKLKDANAIPAIEMAALRATGQNRAMLTELVEIFYAYQEMIGGPDPNTPYWGAPGWGEGAIQTFEEPAPVIVDRHGNVYVADIGNNRVQRFAENGRPDQIWGGDPDIANQWFNTGRPWYVSGSAPGTGAGKFRNPVDVELLPEKESDGFAVLDATGRVQLFDAHGTNIIGWQLHSDNEIEPSVGGEGHLVWLPKKGLLFTFWGSEAIGFNLVGEEQVRFDIEDGTPNTVVAEKGKRFLLVYRDEIIRYDVDGFRYQKVLDVDDYDSGYEDVDLSWDQDGKLWMVTDTGWAFKFKRLGKLDYKVLLTEYSLEHPRFAVREDILYVCERDRILYLDALQLVIDAEEKAAQEEAFQQAIEEAE